MKGFFTTGSLYWIAALALSACAAQQNPYAATNRAHQAQLKGYAKALRATPPPTPGGGNLPSGRYWAGTTNFNLRKPNYVVIHHTTQDSAAQTLKTFTTPRTEVSAHYVVGRDGRVHHMLNDYLRAWHAGEGKWGNDTDVNSSSIGIELDNKGTEPFAEPQIVSLLQLLAELKKAYYIPTANFIGHADIAPARKTDPSVFFPWKRLAEQGFGLWYDAGALTDPFAADSTLGLPGLLNFPTVPLADSAAVDARLARLNAQPPPLTPQQALRLIGYDTRNLPAAIRAFKLHFIQRDVKAPLSEADLRILYSLYPKYQ